MRVKYSLQIARPPHFSDDNNNNVSENWIGQHVYVSVYCFVQ